MNVVYKKLGKGPVKSITAVVLLMAEVVAAILAENFKGITK